MATIKYTALLSAVSSNSCLLVQIANYSLQDNDSTSSLNAHKTPLSLVYSGYYGWVDGNPKYRGSDGDFWSSTPLSPANAHNLAFVSTRLVPQGGGSKVSGFAIHCVGRQIVYKTMTLLLLLMFIKTPLSLVYSGLYYWVGGNLSRRGSNGHFWSSTPYSTANAHYLDFDSTRLIPQTGSDKIYGFTIRCVTQQLSSSSNCKTIVYKTMTLLLLLMLRKLLFPLPTPDSTAG